MERRIVVSDFEMDRTRKIMKMDGYENPTDDEVFDMSISIRERMQDLHMDAIQAYKDIMY